MSIAIARKLFSRKKILGWAEFTFYSNDIQVFVGPVIPNNSTIPQMVRAFPLMRVVYCPLTQAKISVPSTDKETRAEFVQYVKDDELDTLGIKPNDDLPF